MSEATLAALAAYDPFTPTAVPGRRYLLLDVFSERALEGNQLAVFTDGRGIEGTTMQAVARELRLAETVFLLPAGGRGDVRARIFTPQAELPFAGHPVLGASAVVAGALGRDRVVLETGSGPIEVEFSRWRGRVADGKMAQPIPTWEPFTQEQALLEALGVGGSELPIEVYDNGPRHVYVVLASHAQVAAVSPDLRALAALGELGVSCVSAQGLEVKSRMFAPALGVPEDAATGSAAGPLSVHLARHGRIAFGEQIEILQGVELERPSRLLARAEGTVERIERVEVGGSATLVARGEFWLD